MSHFEGLQVQRFGVCRTAHVLTQRAKVVQASRHLRVIASVESPAHFQRLDIEWLGLRESTHRSPDVGQTCHAAGDIGMIALEQPLHHLQRFAVKWLSFFYTTQRTLLSSRDRPLSPPPPRGHLGEFAVAYGGLNIKWLGVRIATLCMTNVSEGRQTCCDGAMVPFKESPVHFQSLQRERGGLRQLTEIRPRDRQIVQALGDCGVVALVKSLSRLECLFADSSSFLSPTVSQQHRRDDLAERGLGLRVTLNVPASISLTHSSWRRRPTCLVYHPHWDGRDGRLLYEFVDRVGASTSPFGRFLLQKASARSRSAIPRCCSASPVAAPDRSNRSWCRSCQRAARAG